MPQTRLEYTTKKSAEQAKQARSEYMQRQDAYTRDMIALDMVQESRPSRPGQASQATWLGLYGKRTPYRAKMVNGNVVLA